ncbi:MAG: nuclear transport factor 2 family protein [Planctomycetes bacterium]|nr:nuclear transport factor 2 family protein [Planctomycetota bacterium]
MKHRWILGGVALLLITSAPPAQDAKKHDEKHPAHDELRKLKAELVDAFNKKDIDALLKHVHPDAVVTWQNGEVTRGPDGVRKYYDRVLGGDKSYLTKVKADPEVTDFSVLIGDLPTTAVAYGKLRDVYTLREGGEINMDSLFSVTAVKQADGRWLIVSFHGSTNVFDNSVLNYAVKKTMWWTGGGVGAVALLLGLGAGFFLGRRKAA